MSVRSRSSGKTFTMFGSDEVSATSLGVDDEPMCATAGLVPRAMAELMDAVGSRKQQGVEMTLRCAFGASPKPSLFGSSRGRG